MLKSFSSVLIHLQISRTSSVLWRGRETGVWQETYVRSLLWQILQNISHNTSENSLFSLLKKRKKKSSSSEKFLYTMKPWLMILSSFCWKITWQEKHILPVVEPDPATVEYMMVSTLEIWHMGKVFKLLLSQRNAITYKEVCFQYIHFLERRPIQFFTYSWKALYTSGKNKQNPYHSVLMIDLLNKEKNKHPQQLLAWNQFHFKQKWKHSECIKYSMPDCMMLSNRSTSSSPQK